jgi:hypothetical protein
VDGGRDSVSGQCGIFLVQSDRVPSVSLLREDRSSHERTSQRVAQSGNPNISSIIAGGSIAGMLTVRVYHDYFERVLLVEPERWLFGNCETTTPWETSHKRSRDSISLSFQNYFDARSS